MNKKQFYFAFLTLTKHAPFTTKLNISTYKQVLEKAVQLGLVSLEYDKHNQYHEIYRITDFGRETITRVEGHLSL